MWLLLVIFRRLRWDKVWLNNNQNNNHDQNPLPLISMNNDHVHEWRQTKWIKTFQQSENNTNSVRWINITFKYQTLTSEIFGISFWALKYGRKSKGWEERRGARYKDIKGVCECVFAYVSFGASPGLSTLFSVRTEADQLCTESLHGCSRGQHRQTAAIKPWLFQVHRVWKGLIEGLWSQWGWSPPPPLPLSFWKVGGGWLGRGGGVRGGLQASRDTCFLLSGPKWDLDKNTPLVACLPLGTWVTWLATHSANTKIKHVIHIINAKLKNYV